MTSAPENIAHGATVAIYRIDSGVSRFTVRAFASGMLAAMGHNPTIAIRDFTGTAAFDPASPERAALEIHISADSLEVTDDIRSGDRREMESTMKHQVLRAEQYPEIVFTSTAVSAEKIVEGRYRVTLDGDLTLRGVTRNIRITPQVTLTGDLLRTSGEFAILQSDYGVPLVSVAGGALKLKDELKLTFDIASRKQA